jgi:hypothetical protein
MHLCFFPFSVWIVYRLEEAEAELSGDSVDRAPTNKSATDVVQHEQLPFQNVDDLRGPGQDLEIKFTQKWVTAVAARHFVSLDC